MLTTKFAVLQLALLKMCPENDPGGGAVSFRSSFNSGLLLMTFFMYCVLTTPEYFYNKL